MHNHYYHLAICSFIYFACTISIYSVHDFTFQVIFEILKDYRLTFLSFSLNIVRTLAFFINNILHRRGWKIGVLLSANIFIYGLSLINIILLNRCGIKSLLYAFFTVGLYFYGCGGLYSCLDGTITSILSQNNLMNYYGVTRIFIIVGHICSYLPGYLVEGSKEAKKHSTKLYLGVVFAMISSLLSYFFLKKYNKQVEKSERAEKDSKLISNRNFICLIFIVLMQGIMKASISITQRSFFHELNISEKSGNTFHFVRNIAEFALSYFTIAKKQSLNALIMVSLICALFRPCLYTYLAYISKYGNIEKGSYYIAFLLGEISKSVLSTIWGYGISRKIYSIISEEQNIRAQSIYNTVYIGLSASMVALYTYSIFNEEMIHTFLNLYASSIFCGIISLLVFIFLID